MDFSKILEILETATSEAHGWGDVADALRKISIDSPDHPLIPFLYAFNYFFPEGPSDDRKGLSGEFSPWFVYTDGHTFPPLLDSIDENICRSWDEVLHHTDDPVICSHLADLLWVKRWGNTPFQNALLAIDNYLKLFDQRGDWDFAYRDFCLRRGLDLALRVNNTERAKVFIQRISDRCWATLKEPQLKPGLTIRLLDSLLNLKQELQPENLSELLIQCIHTYSNDPWMLEDLLMRKGRFDKDNSERKRINEEIVDAWISEADKSSGITAYFDLKKALEHARNFGLSEKAEQIRRRIQDFPEECLGLQEISVTTKLDAEKIEKYISQFTATENWQDSLSRFGLHGPPSGKYDENLKVIEKYSQEFPLQFLLSTSIQTGNNIPIRQSSGLDENKEIALVRNEGIAIQFFSVYAPEIISRIFLRYGNPTLNELTDYFTTEVIPVNVAENLALALEWYIRGEFDVSAHLIVPRIEAMSRVIVDKLGLVIFREPVGNRTGGLLTLNELLEELQGRMDESWRRYLKNVLANPIGVNLRNRICHGLLDKVEQREAVLLLHVAIYLRHFEINQMTNQ